MFDPQKKDGKIQADTTTGVFVSLYLIVLAFFIVMNVISNQVKSKVSASVSSVNDTFKREFISTANRLETPKDKSESTPNLDFQRSIQNSLLFSELELENRHVAAGGSQLRVDINVNDIFLQNSSILNQNISEILEQLVALLKDNDEGEMREFAFFFGYGANQNADVKAINKQLAIQRAGVLARHLQGLNAPVSSFTTGFRETAETKVTAVFRSSDMRNFPVILERLEAPSP